MLSRLHPEHRVFRTAARAAAVLGTVCLCLFLTTGCSTYSHKFRDLRRHLANGELVEALQTVEDEAGSKDRLLYGLERGVILH